MEICSEIVTFVRFSTLPFADEFKSHDLSITWGDATHTLFTREQMLNEITRHYIDRDEMEFAALWTAVSIMEKGTLIDLSN